MKMEDHITDGPLYEEPIDSPEPITEFERDTSLVDTLRNIAETDLHTGLGEDFLKKRQAD